MKKVILFLSLAILSLCNGADTQIVNIPDANFKKVLVRRSFINTNKDMVPPEISTIV